MTEMSKDILFAILSLDVYNRGFGAGLEDRETGLTNEGIGHARVVDRQEVGVDVDVYDQWKEVGFHAEAYDTPYGRVIAYRGTDFDLGSFSGLWEFSKDVFNGRLPSWNVFGAEFGPSPISCDLQPAYALEFYELATEEAANGRHPDDPVPQDEVDRRIRDQIKAGTYPIRLKSDDWRSGDNHWVLDIIAPDEAATTKVLANFGQLAKGGSLKLHPAVARRLSSEVLEKMGAVRAQSEEAE